MPQCNAADKAQSAPMNFTKILAPLAIIVFTIGAWQAFQWAGIALAVGGVVMWVLLHFTRMVTILKKAADRPIRMEVEKNLHEVVTHNSPRGECP